MYKNKHAVEGDFDAAKRAYTPTLVLTWNNYVLNMVKLSETSKLRR